jgi:non-specific protein-tyrosine kinase
VVPGDPTIEAVDRGVDPGALELRTHLRVLWHRKFTILAVVLLLVGVALGAAKLQRPVYEAEVNVLLQPTDSRSLLTPGNDEDPSRKVETQVEVAKSEPVRAAVAKRLGPVPKARVTGLGNSDIIVIRARDEKPERAATITRAYATAYLEYRRSQAVAALSQSNRQIEDAIAALQRQIDDADARIESNSDSSLLPGLRLNRDQLVSRQTVFKQRLDELKVDSQVQTGGAQLVEAGRIPTVKVAPTPIRYAVLAVLGGLVLGVALVLIRESMDDSIRTHDELTGALPGVPVLGLIASVSGWKDAERPLLSARDDPTSPTAESYRSLRTSLQFVGGARPPRIIQVTSALAGEGKTTTVANLGVVIAGAGQRTVLVDCDLRRARLHTFFDLSNDVGFTSLYLGQVETEQAMIPAPGVENLWIVPSGPLPPNPSEVLSDKRTGEVLAALFAHCDLVIVDCAPLLPVTDSTALSVWVDASVLVARASTTTRQTVQRAVDTLLQTGAPLVGTVLNNVRPQGEYAYASSYYSADTGKGSGRTWFGPDPQPDAGTAETVERVV